MQQNLTKRSFQLIFRLKIPLIYVLQLFLKKHMEDVETISTGVFRLRILFCNEEILVEKLGDAYESQDK